MKKALTGSQVTWIHTLVLPRPCCMTLDQSLPFSSLPFPVVTHVAVAVRSTQDQEVPNT